MKAKIVLAMASTLVATGCTRMLETSQFPSATGGGTGIGHVLPFTQYATTVSWTLDSCPAEGSAEPPKIALKVEAVRGGAEDADLSFIIDPQQLQSVTNITAFSAKFHEGTNILSSINVAAEDRSAQIVGNLVKTGIKLLPLFAGAPVSLGAVRCTTDAEKNLVAAKAAKDELEKRTKDVEGATAGLAKANAKVAQMGAALDDGTRTALSEAIAKLEKARSAMGRAAEAFEESLKPIRYSRKFFWPENGSTFSSQQYAIDQRVLDGWVANSAFRAKPVYLQIERTGSFGREPGHLDMTPRPVDPKSPPVRTAKSAPVPVPSGAGIRYRMPAAGALVACTVSPCSSADVPNVIAKFDGSIAQLGYVNVLPFRSRPFGNNAFAAEFGPDGNLKSVSYEQKAAPAEVATGALAGAAEQIGAAFDPTGRLKAKTDYLKGLKDYRDALEATKAKAEDPAALQLSDLNADTTLVNAQLANLKARIELEAMQAAQVP